MYNFWDHTFFLPPVYPTWHMPEMTRASFGPQTSTLMKSVMNMMGADSEKYIRAWMQFIYIHNLTEDDDWQNNYKISRAATGFFRIIDFEKSTKLSKKILNI